MSDFSDIVKFAAERGILLDSCGEAERQYWWGLYNDLCGMSVEDALKVQYYHDNGGDEPAQKKNTINFVMKKGTDEEYTLYLVPSFVPETPVIVSFTMDGVSNTVTIPAGSTTYDTGIKSAENPTKPYAEISSISIQADDPTYKYEPKNSVATGFFKLTIDKDGDVMVDDVKYGTIVSLPTVPEVEGHDFTWTDSKGEVITGSTIEMPEADYSVTGTYTINEYQLSFNVVEEYLDNGSIATRVYTAGTATVDYGEKVIDYVKSYVPSRVGMTITGWKLEDGTDIDANYAMPAQDITVKNRYKLNTYELKYLVDGTVFYQDTLCYGEEIVPVENPSKVGYAFNGWDKEIPATMPAENITTNAKFTAINYYIYYKVDGETIYSEVHHYGDAITIRPDETKTGYTFAWSPSTLPATMPAGDINVVGTFTAIDYTFKCVVDDETVVEKIYNYGDAIDAVDEPSKTGYAFDGWNPSIPTTMPSADVTCVAQFTAIDYTITYTVDGVVVPEYTETHNYGDTIAIREDEEREGYTFSGWNPSELPATMPAENITVAGIFAVNQYTLEYYVDGSLYSAETYDFGEAIVVIDEPSREGYTFSGWGDVPTTMPSHDVTIEATFSINSYTLSYVLDGEPYSSETYEYGAAIVPVAEPSKVGYTFGGWSEIPVTMPAEDITINGTFTVNVHSITYIVDGETYSSETCNYGETIVPIEAPVKVGYTFGEWDGIEQTMPDRDLTVEAVYTINSWVATYRIKSGSTYTRYTAVTYNYGETIVDPTPQEIPGYTFAWEEHAATMPDNNITITGEYTEIVLSTMIYYNTLLNDEISALTDQQIAAFAGNYDGDGVVKQKTDSYMAASQECANYKALAEEAYDEGDDDTGDYYYALYEEYMATHPYSFVFVIPESLTFDKLEDGIGNALTPSIIRTAEIDDTQYDVYQYGSEHMFQTEVDQTIPLFIILK